MRTKKRQFGGLLRWFVVAVMGFTVLIQAMPAPSAEAASLNSLNDLTQKTRLYNEYMMLAGNHCDWKGSPGADAINQPSWFGGNADVGLIVETQDGTIQCSNSGWLSEIIRFATGGTDYQAIYNSVAHSPSNNDQSSSLASYLAKYLIAGSGPNTGSGLSNADIDAMRYQSLYYAFTSSNGCGASNKTLTPQQSNGTGETTYTLQIVDATGKATPTNLTIDNGVQNKDVPVGYSVTGDGVFECREIANQLQNNTAYANAAAAWFAAQPGRSIATGALTNNSNRQTCENSSGLSLAWIVCPIIEFIDNIITGLDSAIQKLLIIDKTQYNNPYVKQVYNTMRNIALALIVPLMLLMVIGTALDFGPFDAYTVKKMFPRLAFSVLAIVLSYPFGVFMIEIANAASSGILGIIGAAFSNNTNATNTATLSSLLSVNGGAGTLGSLALGIGASAAAGALTFGVLGSLALVTAAGLLIGFIVLMLWQILIIFGLILLPIRWFLWSLGGVTGVGDKLDKLLWDGWLGALAFGFTFNTVLGVGRGFASMLAGGEATNFGASLLTPAFIIVAYVGPYFLIKQIAAASGAGLAMLSGAVNDRGKGLFDRQRKSRADSRARAMAKQEAGDRFRDRGVGRALNSVGRRVGVAKKYGMRDTGWAGLTNQSRYQAALGLKQDADAETKLKQDERLQQVKNNDDANNVLALSGGSYSGAREAARDLFTNEHGVYDNVRAERALAAAQAAGISRNSAAAAIKTSAENKWRAVGAGRIDTIDRGLGRLATNDSELSSMRYGAAALARGNGRGDLGGHWSDISFDASNPVRNPAGALHADMADRLATDLAVASGGVGAPVTQEHRDEAQRQVRSHMTALDGMGRTTIHQMLNGHGNQSTAYANAVRFAMDYGDAGPTAPAAVQRAGEELRLTAAQRALEVSDNLSAANGDSQRDYRNFLFDGLGLQAQTTVPLLGGGTGVTASVEEQLVSRAHLAGGALPGSATGVPGNASVIRAGARVYNSPSAAQSGSTTPRSDKRLKRDITSLGATICNGQIKLYSFRYLWSDQMYVGVMAQEVLHVLPAAVVKDSLGFYTVDYAQLGTQMYTLEDWEQQNSLTPVH